MTTTNQILDALLEYRTGFPGLRWNFPAVLGTASIDSGAGIGQGVSLTYSFPATLPAYDDPLEFADYTPLDAAQKTAARAVFQHYANVTNITFTESPTTGNGNIAIGQYLNGFPGGGTVGFAEYPAFQSTEESPPPLVTSVAEAGGGTSGDVWLKTGWAADSEYLPGGGGYEVLLHEIGHAMGLKHPFAELVGDAVLPAALDNTGFTVMSYTRIDHTILVTVAPNGLSWSANNNLNPRTLMVGDMLALQTTYGANTSYRNGNDIYTWQPGERFLETIWDGGGIDTLDAASQTLSSVISLVPGTYSSIGLRQSHADFMAGIPLALQPSISQSFSDAVLYNGADNLGIAYGANIENARGGSGNDRITGNLLANMLTGNAGNDTLDGGSGTDTLMGGIGDDTYIVDTTTDTLTENPGEGTDTIQSSVTFTLATNFENLALTGNFAINGTGNGANNLIIGNGGDNRLDGGGGNDTLGGDSGFDTLIGGIGDDTYIVDSITDTLTENLNDGTDTVESSVTFILGSNIENLTLTGLLAINGTGNGANNTITGNGADNVLNGGAGTDTLIGGAGNDTYIVDSITDTLTENANEGADTVQSSVTFTLGVNIENLTLTGNLAINGTGNGTNNTITGNGADNVLDGGAGTDTLIGGAGNDTYVVDSITDTFTENVNEGADTVQSSVSFTLGANIENLTLTGNLAINGSGNGANNIITGNGVNNTLDGGGGIDTLAGGVGNDTYIVDSTTDSLTENVNEGNDTVQSSVTFALGANIENLTLTGTAGLALTGNTGNNLLTGNAGNNTIAGNAGNDTLDGGAGLDRANFSGNRNAYTVTYDQPNNRFSVAGPDGSDFVRNVEVLQFADSMTVLASPASNAGIVDNFNAYRYLASNPGLIGVFGTDTEAALNHYLGFGFAENRPTAAFSAYQYMASNIALIPFYGNDPNAAIEHYVRFGFGEGRASSSFDALRYLASNPTLINTLGFGTEAIDTHYVQTGFNQQLQSASFNGYRYLDSNLGLLAVFGPNAAAATDHYLHFGYTEGRSATSFDPYLYLASNPALIAPLAASADAASEHYAKFGQPENRPTTSFSVNQYLATNQTLIPFFTGNSAAAIQHFVNFGYAENRPANGFFGQLYLASNPTLIDTIGHTLEATATHYVQTGFAQNLQVEGFNPLQYLASNLGLLNVFGPDAFAAINHYIDFGFHEGRPANTFDGLEYIASNPGLIAVFGTNADAGIAHYVYNGLAEGRPTISFNAQQYHDNYGDLEGKTQGEARTDFISGGLAQGRTDAVVPLSAGATSGADALNGTGGADTLSSGPGNDTLSGGLGNDTLTGGFGADEFVFNTTLGAGNLDRVVDFTHAMDKLMLENAIFAQLGNAGALDASQFVSNVTGVAVDTNDYLVYNNVTGVLSYDANGNAAGAAIAFATLASHPALTAADFTVI